LNLKLVKENPVLLIGLDLVPVHRQAENFAGLETFELTTINVNRWLLPLLLR
jgi:hypothetical protein